MLKTAAAALAVLAATAGAADADTRLGLVGPQTGSNAAFFEQMKQGAQGAVAAINKAGGINGQKMVLDMQDDACAPKQAVAAANKVVSNSDARIIGHFCSSSSIPASDVYADAGLPMISPGSTNPTLTDRGLKAVFRTCGRDDQQAAVAVEAIISHKLGKKIAVVDDKTTYGKGLADGVRKALIAKGLKPVLDDSITQGDKDFSALISRLKAANIDLLYYGGYYAEAGLLVRQSHEQGLKAPLMGGDGIGETSFASIGGPASDGSLMTFVSDPRNDPKAAPIVKAFRDAKFEPQGYTLFTYAAVQAFAEAAKRAKSTDGTKVSAELHKGSYDTVIGNISFDKKGDPNASGFVVYVWKGGTYTPLK